MRVLIVHPHMSVGGGAEKVVLRLSEYLTEKGVKNAVLTLSASSHDENNGHKLRMIVPSKSYRYKVRSAGFFNAVGSLGEIAALRTYIRKHIKQFDVVNVHNFPATWAVHPSQKPCVWTCNEPPDLWGNVKPSPALGMLRDLGTIYDRHLVNESVTRICVADEFNAQRVIERYGRKPEIVSYGIDYDFFSQPSESVEIKKEYGLEDSFVLLQAGWLSPSKNQLASLRTIEELRGKIPNVKLVLAGAGVDVYEKMLHEYVAKKSLREHVIFTGFVNKERTRDLYYASDLVLHPVNSQGGWLVPFEALCASKPLVVSREMTASKTIEREDIGVVTDKFAEAVLEVHNHPERYRRMAAKGRRFVHKNLSWDKFGEKMLAVFEKCLENECD